MEIVMYLRAVDVESLLKGDKVEAHSQRAMPDWYELRVNPDEFTVERQSGMLKSTWFWIQRKK